MHTLKEVFKKQNIFQTRLKKRKIIQTITIIKRYNSLKYFSNNISYYHQVNI